MIIQGDCLEEMRKMESNSISCIVTDPPYGLGFMGKKWDAGLPHEEIWKEALRVCKPGAFILAFGGTRTHHRLTCAIEDAGWEIRDCLQWIYGSGFPKSHNSFGLEGYGTALKPAYEPIIMAMKPCEGTFANNAEKWGQAGVNVDACRVVTTEHISNHSRSSISSKSKGIYGDSMLQETFQTKGQKLGRWPANVIFDEEAGSLLDEQSGRSTSSGGKAGNINACSGRFRPDYYDASNPGFGDKGVASRFFYCAKASRSERGKENTHPTVKPLKLMEYLIKLVMPPKDGLLLDPFCGSGSTLVAAHKLGVRVLGIEKEEAYCQIAQARIDSQEPPQSRGDQPDLFEVG